MWKLLSSTQCASTPIQLWFAAVVLSSMVVPETASDPPKSGKGSSPQTKKESTDYGGDYDYAGDDLGSPPVMIPDRNADGTCAPQHVTLFDGRCERSWRTDSIVEGFEAMAVKPVTGVRTLCVVPEAALKKLQRLAEELPASAWQKPNAEFTATGTPLDYLQVVFHFPTRRGVKDYLIYPLEQKVHDWIEPILLNITAQYNYKNEELPQSPGYLKTSIPRLLLARLGPHSTQRQHSDAAVSSQVPHKIHIPLSDGSTGIQEKAMIHVGDLSGKFSKHELEVGYAYEVNNNYVHYASNSGDGYRTHVLFEFGPKDFGSEQTDNFAPLESEDHNEKRRERKAEMSDSEREALGTWKAKRKRQARKQLARDEAEFHYARRHATDKHEL